MAISFCPMCDRLLIIKKENEKTFLVCNPCNFMQEILDYEGLKLKGIIDKEKVLGEGFVKDNNEFADYDNICKKCGHNKAQIIDMGIFYSDEDNLILLRCGKCGYSERIGRKVS
jgi:DNA-directed RNA polymerase subunit M/transcription elongation factor TFIIS